MSEIIKISVNLKLVPAILYPGFFFNYFRKKQQQLYVLSIPSCMYLYRVKTSETECLKNGN